MDKWSDGEHSSFSFQIAQLAGLIGDYKASRNLVDPEKALSGFVDKNKKKLYEKIHGRYVMRKLLVREMHDDKMEQVLMHQVIHLPFPCETQFIVKEKKDLHYVKFSNGEVSYFCIWLKLGDILTLHLILHQQCLFLLPVFCMYQTVWHLILVN